MLSVLDFFLPESNLVSFARQNNHDSPVANEHWQQVQTCTSFIDPNM